MLCESMDMPYATTRVEQVYEAEDKTFNIRTISDLNVVLIVLNSISKNILDLESSA